MKSVSVISLCYRRLIACFLARYRRLIAYFFCPLQETHCLFFWPATGDSLPISLTRRCFCPPPSKINLFLSFPLGHFYNSWLVMWAGNMKLFAVNLFDICICVLKVYGFCSKTLEKTKTQWTKQQHNNTKQCLWL